MKSHCKFLALAAALVLLTAPASAGTAINEVAAFLVYPSIQATDAAAGADVETFVTVTNAGDENINAHFAFINGDEAASDYCYECNFNVPLTPNDTETLVFRPNVTGGTEIDNEDSGLTKPEFGGENLTAFGGRTCPYTIGMLTAHVEPTDDVGNPTSDNVLIGSEVVVNYTDGYAYSIPAIPFQADGAAGRRIFRFNDAQYTAFPNVIAADFLAPTATNMPGGEAVFFTLNFEHQHPPESDCSIVPIDANEVEGSFSILFGCWTKKTICSADFDLDSCWGNLGAAGDHTHGWFYASCEVDRDPDDPSVDPDSGNVHGAIIQRAATGTSLRKNDAGAPTLSGAAAWARLFYQSNTNADPGVLELVESGGPGGGLD